MEEPLTSPGFRFARPRRRMRRAARIAFPEQRDRVRPKPQLADGFQCWEKPQLPQAHCDPKSCESLVPGWVPCPMRALADPPRELRRTVGAN